MKYTISNQKQNTDHSIILSIILVLLTIMSAREVHGLQISEIMFNPDGADTGREWIEIELNSSDGCINLTQYKLFEENTNHNIYSYNEDVTCASAVICNDINKFLIDYEYLNRSASSVESPLNITIYRSTFSLSNTGEELAIRHNAEFIDYINYSMILSQVSITEGHSIEYVDDAWRNSILLKGNPGNILNGTDIDLVEDTNNTIDGTNTTTETVNETLDNTTTNMTDVLNNTYNSADEYIDDILDEINITNDTIDTNLNLSITNLTQNYTDTNNNITDTNIIKNTTNTNNIVNNCRVSIKTVVKNISLIQENNIPIKFYNILEFENVTLAEKNYSIEYWIEDLFGNIIKNRVTTNNQDEKTYTPKIEENDKVLVIRNILKDINCNITKNSSESILIIKNVDYAAQTTQKCPSCECESSKESTTCKDKATDTYTGTHTGYVQECNQKPLIKTVNVCNTSTELLKGHLDVQNATQSIYELSSTNNLKQDIISNTSNNTQHVGKTTGMIIYESPNLKNRVYAIVGLILVGVTCLGMIFYRLFKRKSDTVI